MEDSKPRRLFTLLGKTPLCPADCTFDGIVDAVRLEEEPDGKGKHKDLQPGATRSLIRCLWAHFSEGDASGGWSRLEEVACFQRITGAGAP